MNGVEGRGCLLLALPRALLGGRQVPALPEGLALPVLDTQTIAPEDLPVLIRARNASRVCHGLVQRVAAEGASGHAVGEEFVGLVGRIFQMGAGLQRARGFVSDHHPDKVARDRADLELELVGASSEQIPELRHAFKALDARAAQVADVQREVERLATRLASTTEELEGLRERLADAGDPEGLLHEVRAWHQSAALAIEAFDETVGSLQ